MCVMCDVSCVSCVMCHVNVMCDVSRKCVSAGANGSTNPKGSSGKPRVGGSLNPGRGGGVWDTGGLTGDVPPRPRPAPQRHAALPGPPLPHHQAPRRPRTARAPVRPTAIWPFWVATSQMHPNPVVSIFGNEKWLPKKCLRLQFFG